MQAIDYGYSLLTTEQHLLSPNSTGHSYNGQCHSHRCHSHSCKSAPAEQQCDENNREFEDGHWLFSPRPHTLHLRPTVSGASCQTRRAPEACKDRPLTPVSPNSVGSEDIDNQWEHSADDELISNWLSGVSYSNRPNEETSLTRQSTPAVSPDAPDPEGKADVVPSFTCPSIFGTGLDGPLSSESDKLSKLLRDGPSDLKESSRSADLSGSSQKVKSSHRARLVDPSPVDNNSNEDSCTSSGDENVSDEKSYLYLSWPDSQFRVIQRHAHNSCPEFCRQLDAFERPSSKPESQGTQAAARELRPKVDKSRSWHHLRVRNIRIRRSGSSTFSIRSEFPAPLHSKERRLLARNSIDLWPPSGEESPLFNTPESNVTNAKRISQEIRRHIDPLAIASVMIATAELDRLSSRSLDQVSRTSDSSTGISGNSPTSHTPFHSGAASPNNEMSSSTSPVLDIPPTIPFDTPSPGSKSSQRRGRQRRGRRSRLSEVTTPGDVTSPAESIEEFNDALPECSSVPSKGTGESLYPKPLIIGHSSEEEVNSFIDDASKYLVPLQTDSGKGLGTLQRLPGSLASDVEDVAPSRVSSTGEISKTGIEPFLPSMPLGLGYTFPMPTTSSNLIVPMKSRETYNIHSSSTANMESDTSAIGAMIDYIVATGQPDKVEKSDSCHQDT
ncbi:hypothetical protein F4814DRAFT_438648 [Daldinia grandis]|nr:hypothetical protein F4814DRAFT_438648 [Daldinia grandis]